MRKPCINQVQIGPRPFLPRSYFARENELSWARVPIFTWLIYHNYFHALLYVIPEHVFVRFRFGILEYTVDDSCYLFIFASLVKYITGVIFIAENFHLSASAVDQSWG